MKISKLLPTLYYYIYLQHPWVFFLKTNKITTVPPRIFTWGSGLGRYSDIDVVL